MSGDGPLDENGFPIDEPEDQPRERATEDDFAALDYLAGYLLEEHVIPRGFFGKPLHTELLLWISEVIELFEDDRNGKTVSEKIPEFTIFEEEAADLLIRVLSACAEHKWRIGAAARAKHQYNLNRPHKHGKKF